MARKLIRPKALYQIKFTYFLIALFALIAAANHLNFASHSVADLAPVIPVQDAPSPAPASLPAPLGQVAATQDTKIATSFAQASIKTPLKPQKTTPQEKDTTLHLPVAIRVFIGDNEELPDAGSGIKTYASLLYAHSTRAGRAFKTLQIGDVFTATIDGVTKTYRVSSRAVYAHSSLDINGCGSSNSPTCRSARSLLHSLYHYSGITLMTCGNGYNDDSSYRLALFAEEI